MPARRWISLPHIRDSWCHRFWGYITFAGWGEYGIRSYEVADMNIPTATERRIQVLIVHGSPLMAAGLAAALCTQQDLCVITCTSLEETTQAASKVATNSIVATDYECGLRLLTGSGLRTCRVLMVTNNDSELGIRHAVELGVAGYLPLTCSSDVLIRAVRCLHGGGTMIDPVFISRIAASLASPSLTARELEVLRLVMEGLPNKAIALRLKRSVGTAKSHVKAILSKLDAATRVEAVAVAQRRGLLPREHAPLSSADADVDPRLRELHKSHWSIASPVSFAWPRSEEST